jgi:hypothetical protein
VDQGSLVGVVVVGRIDEDAVRERGERAVCARAGAAPQAGNGVGSKAERYFACDARLLGIVPPGAERAAYRVENDIAGLGNNGVRQGFECQPGNELG